MTGAYFLALGAVLMTAASQLLMKIGAHRNGSLAWRIYLNPWTLTAYALLVVVTLMNLCAFMTIPLKMALVFLPLTLLLVLFLSCWLLHERLTRRQLCGAGVTLAGLLLFAL